jgi:phosphatidylinositol glycan class M
MSGKKYRSPASIAKTTSPSIKTKPLLTNQRIQLLSFIIQLGLIAYGEYHDRHNVLKYTDIDYRVFSDAVHALWTPDLERGNVARGPLTSWMGWTLGE